MHQSGVELDEEQDVQAPQPDGVDREEVARRDPGRLLTQERLPRATRPPWRWVQSMAAQRGADRGRRDTHAEPEELALDALVASA
jgi:hypothetical protein